MANSTRLLPIIVGGCVYLIVKNLFYNDLKNVKTNLQSDFRGGENEKLNHIRRISKKITKQILKNRPLVIAMLASFSVVTIQAFILEIQTLLSDEVFKYVCVQNLEGEPRIKILCDIIENHDLHTKAMETLIVSNKLTRAETVSLLKIKLEYIINLRAPGKIRFLLMTLLAGVTSWTVSGTGGLAIFLEALYNLWKEGRISRAVYEDILRILPRIWGVRIRIDHFRD